MKHIVSALLIVGLIASVSNCKEKKAAKNDAVTKVKLGGGISNEQAVKASAFLTKGQSKAGKFRQEDVPNADYRVITYLLGCNLAELTIAIKGGNKELFTDAMAGLDSIANRGGAIGNFPWAQNVVKALAAYGESRIDKEQAIAAISEIAKISAEAAGENEGQYNILFGYATFLSAAVLSSGMTDAGFAPIIDDYLASLGHMMSPGSKAAYEQARTLIAEGKSAEAGAALFQAASKF